MFLQTNRSFPSLKMDKKDTSLIFQSWRSWEVVSYLPLRLTNEEKRQIIMLSEKNIHNIHNDFCFQGTTRASNGTSGSFFRANVWPDTKAPTVKNWDAKSMTAAMTYLHLFYTRDWSTLRHGICGWFQGFNSLLGGETTSLREFLRITTAMRTFINLQIPTK